MEHEHSIQGGLVALPTTLFCPGPRGSWAAGFLVLSLGKASAGLRNMSRFSEKEVS